MELRRAFNLSFAFFLYHNSLSFGYQSESPREKQGQSCVPWPIPENFEPRAAHETARPVPENVKIYIFLKSSGFTLPSSSLGSIMESEDSYI